VDWLGIGFCVAAYAFMGLMCYGPNGLIEIIAGYGNSGAYVRNGRRLEWLVASVVWPLSILIAVGARVPGMLRAVGSWLTAIV